MIDLILIRGGGDLASGTALRLYRCGYSVVISELQQPLAVRRTVSFSEAVYSGQVKVESVTATLVKPIKIMAALEAGQIPVLVDPHASILMDPGFASKNTAHCFEVVVDARLTKHSPDPLPAPVETHIGLGPGFIAGKNCHAVIETRRSHTLGRVFWSGETQQDTGLPEGESSRVLRAPSDGILVAAVEIGQHVEKDQKVAEIVPRDSQDPREQQVPVDILAPFSGLVRGLIHPGLYVTTGLKIGDIDPRDDPAACSLVSDKALAIGGGVLEAILSHHKALRSIQA
jgi:xanthine dehydrogenase accessory factor